jgi:hypothetical protein
VGLLGIRTAPCPQTIINWVIRLAVVRLDSARACRGFPLEAAPLTPGLIGMIDSRLGLGCGTLRAVVAWEAHPPQREAGAPTRRQVRCRGVAVAPSWHGDPIADFLERLIAPMGRPVASRKDGGSDGHQAVA